MKRILLFTLLTCFAWTLSPSLVGVQDAQACVNSTNKARVPSLRLKNMDNSLAAGDYASVISMGKTHSMVDRIMRLTAEDLSKKDGETALGSINSMSRTKLVLVAIANTRSKGAYEIGGVSDKNTPDKAKRALKRMQWSAVVLESLASKKFKNSVVKQSRRGTDALAAEAIAAVSPKRRPQMLKILKALDAKQRINHSATYSTYAQLLTEAGEDALATRATKKAQARLIKERALVRTTPKSKVRKKSRARGLKSSTN